MNVLNMCYGAIKDNWNSKTKLYKHTITQGGNVILYVISLTTSNYANLEELGADKPNIIRITNDTQEEALSFTLVGTGTDYIYHFIEGFTGEVTRVIIDTSTVPIVDTVTPL